MNPKKLKEKDRRRARKLAEEAWDAVDQGNLDLAEKIVRRAVLAQPDNPVLWDDQGVILGMRRKESEAGESFRTALSLAPTFAEPFAHLAAMLVRQGFANEAVHLQSQAVKHAPENAGFAEQLAAYRSLAGEKEKNPVQPPSAATVEESERDAPCGDWPQRVAGLDWAQIADRLTRVGCVQISGVLEGSTCEGLRAMYDEDERFAKTVTMDRPDYGLGEYRYFAAPIPEVVDQLRRAFFPHVSRIANGWSKLLGEEECYPDEWVAYRDECRRAGQSTPTPILLKYRAGGFNALHRDLRGPVFFPIQLAVVLSQKIESNDPQIDGFQGGEFVFCDVPATKKSHRRELSAGLGDAVLFCTRDRLVLVGDSYGLQPVKHGVNQITAGTRFVLGVPFHEYR